MSAAGSVSESKSSLLVLALTKESGVEGASFQLPHPQLPMEFAASEQIIGGAPFAAVSSAVTSMGMPRWRPCWKASLDAGPPTDATTGPPLREENAKVAMANPSARCMITPFIVPAFVAGRLKNQHYLSKERAPSSAPSPND